MENAQKLPERVLWYWLVKQLLFFAIIGFLPLLLLMLIGTEGWTDSQTGEAVNPETIKFIGMVIPVGALGLYILTALYTCWYFITYTYTVGIDRLSIKSGVIVTSDKSVQFEEAENTSLVRGPLLMLFGLGNLRVFTSSPGQLQIVTTKNGTRTIHKPDVDIVLPIADTSALAERFSKAVNRVAIIPAAQVLSGEVVK
jgi:membrane protein YdbS with pleckstrin-like domain